MLLFIGPLSSCFTGMITRCEECGHELAGDEAEHLYRGKSYCDDCYKTVKATEIS